MGVIAILLEHVEQKVASINEKKQRGEKVEYCPFKNVQHLKCKLMQYSLFLDNNIKIIFTSKDTSREYIERIICSKSRNRCDKINVEALGRKLNKKRAAETEEIQKNGKVFFGSLLVTIRGVSDKTIKKITNQYPTFRSLTKQYSVLNQEDAEKLLNRKCKIKSNLSKKIYQEFSL